jgi:hypothetical protein
MTQQDQDLWDKARQQNDPYSEPTVPFSQAPVPPPMPPYGQGSGSMYQGMPDQGALYPGSVAPAMAASGTSVQKKRPGVRKWLVVAAGAIVLLLLGIGGFVLLPILTAKTNNQASTTTSAPAAAPPTSTTGKPANKNVYAPYLANYRMGIRSQMAQGLHLTVEQMNTQLEAGKTLSSIATAQGVSASQLQTLVTNTFQSAFQPAIDNQGLTQKQVTALIKRMINQPVVLDRYLMVRAKKGVVATPVVQ